jgi:chromosome partitioning protein
MKKIVVANLKGGSGKTTIATTLAAWWAGKGYKTCLLDIDPQQAASAWLRRRPANRPPIHGLRPPTQATGVTLSFALRIPHDTQRLVVDTPAGLSGTALADTVRGATAVTDTGAPRGNGQRCGSAHAGRSATRRQTGAPLGPLGHHQ